MSNSPNGQLTPRTIHPMENVPHGQCTLRTARPMDNSPNRQLAIDTVHLMDNSLINNVPHVALTIMYSSCSTCNPAAVFIALVI
jgi:hypothetical protein